jgi:biopolymer transport protein ExbB
MEVERTHQAGHSATCRLPHGEELSRRRWAPAWKKSALGFVVALGVLSGGISAGGLPSSLAQESPLKTATGQPEREEAGNDDEAADLRSPVIPDNPIPTRNLLDAIRDGGALMVPIGLCSFILFVFVFERAISLRRGRVIPGPFVRLFIQQLRERQLDRQSALELCQQNRSPVAEVFAAAMKKWGRPAVEVEQAIIDEGERVSNGLRRYLRLFNGIATLTPLLGLLGTVFGMISSFNAIATADAMGRPELLAGGISQALITTAAGLTVAIPALTAYLWFVGRVDRLIIDIDSLGQQVVECISADAWQDTGGRGEKSSGKRSTAA